MKTFVLTTASTLLLTSFGIGYAVHANADTTQVPGKNDAANYQKYKILTEDIQNFPEYDILDDIVDAEDFNAQVVENNNHKRIIFLKDDSAKLQFKSVFIKDTNRLQVIDLKGGLIFSQIIGDAEENVDSVDNGTENEDSVNETIEEDSQDKGTIEQGLEGLKEYSTLVNFVNVEDFNTQVVENNNHKRVILLKDNQGQPQFKSIYVKDTNRLKIINLRGGIVYNGIIQ
ncbi:hypothetical protein [Cytobacillus sp. FSL H8-0458]|uniref:hypothetical protein n=1 Tax=Cytobacillus sp. FSL H8-0458 TaxID=2975346 RepID=UPI0030FBDB56